MFTTPFAFMAQAGEAPPPSPIPLEGLVLALDAGDPACYPGSGTLVNDLSSFANTGTFSDPQFSAGAFVFTDSAPANVINFLAGSQYGFTETWTYVIYVNPTTSSTSYWAEKSNSLDNLSLVYGYDGQACRPWRSNYDGMTQVSTPIGEWSFVAFTKDANEISNNYKSYKNGILVQELSSDFTLTVNTTGFRFNGFDPGSFQMKNFYCYNRALTAGEVNTIYDYVVL